MGVRAWVYFLFVLVSFCQPWEGPIDVYVNLLNTFYVQYPSFMTLTSPIYHFNTNTKS